MKPKKVKTYGESRSFDFLPLQDLEKKKYFNSFSNIRLKHFYVSKLISEPKKFKTYGESRSVDFLPLQDLEKILFSIHFPTFD